jgi:hypothetical protein
MKRKHRQFESLALIERRRHLRDDNRLYPAHLVEIPKEQWPPGQENRKATVVAVWRSNRFLVQIIQEPREGVGLRLTVNRTALNAQGDTWEEGITWDDLMHIKRQCGHAESWAVEIFPADSHTVNVSAMRHLWLLASPPPQSWLSRTAA